MRRPVLVVITAFILVILGAGAFFYHQIFLDWQQPADKTVFIRRGSSVAAIARQLHEQDLIRSPAAFKIRARLTGNTRNLKAGEYLIPARSSVSGIVKILAEGRTVLHRIQAIEGLSNIEILEIITQAEGLTGDVPYLPDYAGLMPETYFYSYGATRESIVNRMRNEMDSYLASAWENRTPGLPLRNKREALILASIVERETHIPAERPKVASVFINRLRKGMRLQSDPTVIFAVTDGRSRMERLLTTRDLRRDHPMNTYTRHGLPPVHIANPSRSSIDAVLNPVETEYYFFVAHPDGGHSFSRTLAEHNRSVQIWRSRNRR
ncbi:MAG: endolytic transglycosylase MltG [Alphaproteobacteria bacterium]|nr:endolytic transglycosylase MltG [Alphaproteobacteria bacterium]